MKEVLETSLSLQIRTVLFTDVYTVVAEIGRGKFAVVKRCIHKQSGLDYAAKFVHKRRKGRDCRQAVLREVQMLEIAHGHSRIVDIVEVFENNNEIIIVTEYARGGELFDLIDVEGRLEEKDVVRLMRQIIDGLAFLHNKNIVHMDIKPQNILLTRTMPDADIKLCDLGLARAMNEDILEIIGTPDYVAPEVLDYKPLSSSCDMWSVGVLAYVMLTGCSPFAGDTRQETFLNIAQVNLDFPDELFSTISPAAINFIQSLLICEPRDRLTALECLDHEWLREEMVISLPPQQTSPLESSPLGQRKSPPQSSVSNYETVKKHKCDNHLASNNNCPEPGKPGRKDLTIDDVKLETCKSEQTVSDDFPMISILDKVSSTADVTCSRHDKENQCEVRRCAPNDFSILNPIASKVTDIEPAAPNIADRLASKYLSFEFCVRNSFSGNNNISVDNLMIATQHCNGGGVVESGTLQALL